MPGKDEPAASADNNKTEPQQPAQVHGKLLSDEESHEWGTNLQIVEKDAKTEQNALRTEFEDAASNDDTEEAETADTETEEDVSTESEEVVQPEVQYIEDPGEFTPGDYSFDVTVFDKDGNKPKTVKVSSIDQWEQLLEEEPNLGSSVAVNKAFRQAQKMELNQEADQKAWAKDKEEYEQALANEKLQETRNNTIFNEINYLVGRGDLPKLTQEEQNNLNWDDAAVQKAHPNIAPHKELLNYMRSENATRLKNGLAPLNSALDAYNAMQLDTRRQADVETRKAAGEARKAAGARVSSGSSTPLSVAQPKGIAVGRVGDISRLGNNWNV